MSAQSKKVQGAGIAERQEDWTLESILWDYAENKSLSRRKRKFLASEMELALRHLNSNELATPSVAPGHLCDAFGAAPGTYWFELGCWVLEKLEVPFYELEEWKGGVSWCDDVSALLINNRSRWSNA